jgi:hypothetical protein
MPTDGRGLAARVATKTLVAWSNTSAPISDLQPISKDASRVGANVAIAAKTAEPHPKLKSTIFTTADEVRAAGGPANLVRVPERP